MTLILLIVAQGFLSTVDTVVSRSDTLDLAQAYYEAEQAAPARSEFEIQRLTSRLNQLNYSTAFLPEFAVLGQAVYNSEVAEIPIALPGQAAPSISNDQYKLGLSIEQLVFDGGSVKKKKDLEDATLEYANQNVNVALYSIRQHVDRSYFAVLIARARLESLNLRGDDLNSKLQEVEALVDEGVLTATNSDRITVELLNLEQQKRALAIEARTALDILGEWMGRPLPDDIALDLPDPSLPPQAERLRPEFKQFDLARTVLVRQEAIRSLARQPKLSSFGEVAYGRAPGLNLFENSFKPYFSVGLRLRWAVWDWNRTGRDRQTIRLKQRSLDVTEFQFQRQLRIELAQKMRTVGQLQSALETDNEVIELRQRIREDAETRFDNGVANATDYIREINAEQLAILARNLRQIELSKALIEYQTIQGTR